MESIRVLHSLLCLVTFRFYLFKTIHLWFSFSWLCLRCTGLLNQVTSTMLAPLVIADHCIQVRTQIQIWIHGRKHVQIQIKIRTIWLISTKYCRCQCFSAMQGGLCFPFLTRQCNTMYWNTVLHNVFMYAAVHRGGNAVQGFGVFPAQLHCNTLHIIIHWCMMQGTKVQGFGVFPAQLHCLHIPSYHALQHNVFKYSAINTLMHAAMNSSARVWCFPCPAAL